MTRRNIAVEHGRDSVIMGTIRQCTGERLQWAPGLTGQIIQHGDGVDMKTIAIFRVSDIDAWLLRGQAVPGE